MFSDAVFINPCLLIRYDSFNKRRTLFLLCAFLIFFLIIKNRLLPVNRLIRQNNSDMQSGCYGEISLNQIILLQRHQSPLISHSDLNYWSNREPGKFLFIANTKFLSAFSAAPRKDFPPVFSFHSFTETMFILSFCITWLKCAFQTCSL